MGLYAYSHHKEMNAYSRKLIILTVLLIKTVLEQRKERGLKKSLLIVHKMELLVVSKIR